MFPIRGTQWQFGSNYNSDAGRISLAELKSTIPDANFLYFDAYVDITNDSVVKARTSWPIIDDKAYGIGYAKSQGYKVAFKVKPVQEGGAERNYTPTDPAEFFTNLQKTVLVWAAEAAYYGVDLVSVGCENDNFEGDEFTDYWRLLIAAVKAAIRQGNMSAEVFYTTNNWSDRAEYDRKLNARWMDDLDRICISCYWKLVQVSILQGYPTYNTLFPYPASGLPSSKATPPGTPSVAYLVSNYLATFIDGIKGIEGGNIGTQVHRLSEAHGNKPILFHMGLQARHGGAYDPWQFKGPAKYPPEEIRPDPEGQLNWFKAFYEVMPKVAGVDGWLLDSAWHVKTLASKDPYAPVDASVQNLPSAAFIEQAFRDLSPVPVTVYLSISAAAGGTTDPPPGNIPVSSGSIVQVKALPDENYKFTGWQLDGAPVQGNPIDVLMDANHTLQALFTYVPPPPIVGALAGHVTDSATHEPVPGALVTLNGYADITEVDGHYEFLSLPPGLYALNVTKEGYVPTTVPAVDVKAGVTFYLDLNLTLSTPTPPMDLSFIPGILLGITDVALVAYGLAHMAGIV